MKKQVGLKHVIDINIFLRHSAQDTFLNLYQQLLERRFSNIYIKACIQNSNLIVFSAMPAKKARVLQCYKTTTTNNAAWHITVTIRKCSISTQRSNSSIACERRIFSCLRR